MSKYKEGQEGNKGKEKKRLKASYGSISQIYIL
jgi:hypothetical protein